MAELKATPEQQAAIDPGQYSLLVSAGAGSGKTWVLTERLLNRIASGRKDRKPADITEFLVITYTRAAAGELKARISEGLSKREAEENAAPAPDRNMQAHLRRQRALIGRAQISTIHAFCAELLREYGMEKGIRPDFRIIEEEQAEKLKQTALNRVLEKRYAAPETFPGFLALTETLGRGRDDRALAQLTVLLDGKLQSHAYPVRWVERQKELLKRDYPDFASSPWGKELISGIRSKAAYWAGRMRRALEEIAAENGAVCGNYRDSFAATVRGLETLFEAADPVNGSWEKIRNALPVPYPKPGTRKVEDTDFRERMKAIRDQSKKAVEGFTAVFSGDPEKMLADIRETAPVLEALMDLALDFRTEYDREKQRRAFLDYSDLEHLAAQLLTDEDGTPTAAAERVSGRYREILVDEYQDVSPVQETIFNAVSRGGDNLVMVGDIKQSIYRFRLADPVIFNRKYERFADYRNASGTEPRKIPMKANFRSRKEIIAAVNSIFRTCMSRELGDVDYTEPDQQLSAEAPYAGEGEKPRLVLIQPSAKELRREMGNSKRDEEAAWVAAEIRRLVSSGVPVKDQDGQRPIRWSDVAILLRSFQRNEPVFRRELEKRGIPVVSSTGADLYAEPETAFLMNMLSVVDNPHKDIPLLAVLRSPAFGFTADELAMIRVGERNRDLYDALQTAARENGKCRTFLSALESYRKEVPEKQVSELVWRIICEQDLLAISSAMDQGEQRRDRVLGFIELCGKFEESGSHGLHSFLDWLERLNDRGLVPETVSGRSDGVSILTIHRSKGLEYPAVFVCDTGAAINDTDARGNVLVDPELGLGCKKIDPERMIAYPTAAHRAVAEKLRRDTRSEEMRLMYVALTRAKEYLVITGTDEKAGEMIEQAREETDGRMPDPEYLAGCRSALQWFAAAAAADNDTTFRTEIVAAPAEGNPEEDQPEAEREMPDEKMIFLLEQMLRRNLNTAYAFREAEDLPSKITATELKGQRSDGEESDAANLIADPDEAAYSFPLPSFAHEPVGLTAAERGTATHTLLQHLDWSTGLDEQDIRREIEKARTAGFLTEEEAAAVDLAAVRILLASPLGKRMAAAFRAGTMKREFRFSLLVDAEQLLFSSPSEEKILLQGVVDCFFEEGGEIVIVDYKTDRVFDEQKILERSEFYRGQLEAYAGAVSRICGKNVKECILYFLAPAKEVSLLRHP